MILLYGRTLVSLFYPKIQLSEYMYKPTPLFKKNHTSSSVMSKKKATVSFIHRAGFYKHFFPLEYSNNLLLGSYENTPMLRNKISAILMDSLIRHPSGLTMTVFTESL